MKERMKGFAAGVCASVLIIGLSATALAASGTVSFNSVNLRFNGTQISTKGENFTISSGASVPSSILYTDENGGGTTYLPVARVSELLGVDIAWDGAMGSVVIGEEKSSTADTTAPAENTTDYSTWSAEKEAAYQEFKAMWTIELLDKGDVKYRMDGTYEDTPWEAYRIESVDELSYAEIQEAVVPAWEQGFVTRLAHEIGSPNRKITMCFYDNSVLVSIRVIEQ